MDTRQTVMMTHPDIPDSRSEVGIKAFTHAWAAKGWVLVEDEGAPTLEDVYPDAAALLAESVDDILTSVGDNKHLARTLLALERSGRKRVTLISGLEEVATEVDLVTDAD